MYLARSCIRSDEISLSTPPQRYSSAAQRCVVPCPAMPCRALQLSSVAHRNASSAERIAVCFPVLYHASPWCVLCCTFTSSYIHARNIRSIIPRTGTCTYTRFVRTYILRRWIMNNAPPVQVSPAIDYIAQQHSAAKCGAVPCPSFCDSVLCGAVRSFEYLAVVVPGMIQVPGSCTRCVLVFLLSTVDCLLSVPMPPPPPLPSK